MSMEQAMLARARPQVLANRIHAALAVELSKGCRRELCPKPYIQAGLAMQKSSAQPASDSSSCLVLPKARDIWPCFPISLEIQTKHWRINSARTSRSSQPKLDASRHSLST